MSCLPLEKVVMNSLESKEISTGKPHTAASSVTEVAGSDLPTNDVTMYARVARFEGAQGDALRHEAEDIASRAPSGPPEGVPATGFLMLVDPDGGRSLAISLFETEHDLRKGNEKLNSMSPGSNDAGRRTSVETYEVAVDLRG